MPRIELNGEREPVWLTHHLRDPQPEGERESTDEKTILITQQYLKHAVTVTKLQQFPVLQNTDQVTQGQRHKRFIFC